MEHTISLIICSRFKDISQSLKDNVIETIGDVSFEWVIINNSKNQYNIFQAYNEGVRKSSGEVLCFMHDDIIFHTKAWGGTVCDYFNTYSNLGCLGVAGSHLLLNTPSSFWHSAASCVHYYSRDPNGDLVLIEWPKEKNEKGLTKVASVDGIWMCIRKSLFDTIRFDDTLYDGFHCYDSDICMQILQSGFDIGVTFDIGIEHNRNGNQDACYFNNIRKWHKKWTDFLPVVRGATFSDEVIGNRTYYVKQIVELEEQIATMQRNYNSTTHLFGKKVIITHNNKKNKNDTLQNLFKRKSFF